jgi:hypothetical protein
MKTRTDRSPVKPRAVLALLGAAFLLAACGSGPAAAQHPGAAPAAPAAPAAVHRQVPACSVLTQQDAQALLGATVAKESDEGTVGGGHCSYSMTGPPFDVVGAGFSTYPSAADARRAYTSVRQPDSPSKQNVAGLGDAAYLQEHNLVVELFVLHGSLTLQLDITKKDVPVESLRTLAESLLTRAG